MEAPKGGCPSTEERYPIEEAIRRLAPSRATVLLIGGSNQTKVRVAHALHERSPRARHPFVAVDCSVIAATNIEEVLFGGPSLGLGARPNDAPRGAIGAADGGTLWVATVDALPVALQPRFLHFLDDALTVRVVVSTDADLAALARRRLLRADLGERLSLVCIDLSEASEV